MASTTNIESQQLVLSRVATVFQSTTHTIIDLTIRDSHGPNVVLSGTPNHPFFVPALRQYVEMGKLEQGTVLRTDSGTLAVISATQTRRGEFTVYNFEVAGTHNYFVASPNGGPWVLVHNNPCSELGGVLQSGGHTINAKTAEALGLTKEQTKRAIEALKHDLHLPNDFHSTKIHEFGDVTHKDTGEWLGNLFDYVKGGKLRGK